MKVHDTWGTMTGCMRFAHNGGSQPGFKVPAYCAEEGGLILDAMHAQGLAVTWDLGPDPIDPLPPAAGDLFCWQLRGSAAGLPDRDLGMLMLAPESCAEPRLTSGCSWTCEATFSGLGASSVNVRVRDQGAVVFEGSVAAILASEAPTRLLLLGKTEADLVLAFPPATQFTMGPVVVTGDSLVFFPDASADPVDHLASAELEIYGEGVSARFIDIEMLSPGIPVAGVGEEAPSALVLARPWPNPSRGAVETRFALAAAAAIRADVYDLSGRRVRELASGTIAAGTHALQWDGTDDGGMPVSAGLYFLRVGSEGVRLTARMIRLR